MDTAKSLIDARNGRTVPVRLSWQIMVIQVCPITAVHTGGSRKPCQVLGLNDAGRRPLTARTGVSP
jgi:hypothetical protein